MTVLTTMTSSTNRINFTKASIENLPIPESGWKYYYDTKVPGLAVGVGASGVKTYVLYKKINRRPERIKIGRTTDLTVDEARTKAIEHNGKVALGSNPADKKRQQRAEITFGEMFALFYEQHSKPHKKTHKEDLAKFTKYLSDRKYGINLAKRRLSEIGIGEIKTVFNKIAETHPITANRVLALVSSVFSEAIRAELYAGLNPCRGVIRDDPKGGQCTALFQWRSRQPLGIHQPVATQNPQASRHGKLVFSAVFFRQIAPTSVNMPRDQSGCAEASFLQ